MGKGKKGGKKGPDQQGGPGPSQQQQSEQQQQPQREQPPPPRQQQQPPEQHQPPTPGDFPSLGGRPDQFPGLGGERGRGGGGGGGGRGGGDRGGRGGGDRGGGGGDRGGRGRGDRGGRGREGPQAHGSDGKPDYQQRDPQEQYPSLGSGGGQGRGGWGRGGPPQDTRAGDGGPPSDDSRGGGRGQRGRGGRGGDRGGRGRGQGGGPAQQQQQPPYQQQQPPYQQQQPPYQQQQPPYQQPPQQTQLPQQKPPWQSQQPPVAFVAPYQSPLPQQQVPRQPQPMQQQQPPWQPQPMQQQQPPRQPQPMQQQQPPRQPQPMQQQQPPRQPQPMQQPQQYQPTQQVQQPPPSEPSPGLSTSMSKLQVSPPKGQTGKWKIPERKVKMDKNMMVGTKGRPITIEVNHLLLTLSKLDKLAYHYDCAFNPDTPKKMLRSAIMEMKKLFFPKRNAAFDGRKNLYSYGPLFEKGDTVRETVQVVDEERSDGKLKEFDVTIKEVGRVDLSLIKQYLENGINFPQDAIQVLDIVLRNPSTIKFTPVGRSYFSRPERGDIIKLGNGLELWRGFYQTATLGWKPFLNVDVAHKGFPEPKLLLDVMLDFIKKNQRYNDPDPTLDMLKRENALSGNVLEDFNKYIKSLKVIYMIPNQPNTRRIHKMNGTRQPCHKQRFTLEDGRNITIGEYFQRDKNYPLKFPYLPSIHVGNPQRDICLPPELCTIIAGQAVMRKLDDTQTAAMVKAAARPADERKQRILAAMRSAGFNKDPCVTEFGITVAEEFQKVKARVLDPPNLMYANNRKMTPRAGVWRADRFLESSSIQTWVVFSASTNQRGPRDQDLRKFADTIISQGSQLGMNIAPPYKMECLGQICRDRIMNGDQLRRALRPIFEGYKKDGAQLVVTVVGDRPPDSYSKVKQCAEIDVGLLTQCVKENTFLRKMNPATAGNILLKINAKLNGTNHMIDRGCCPNFMNVPTMLVGADVTHPSPDQTAIPSVAAVAASHDRRGFLYNMIWRLQPPRVEIIATLEEIMREHLLFFYRANKNQKPQKILIYRDGVSEGQFSQVLEGEMSAIRRACTRLEPGYQPKVTFLVVQKRHHTRFFPTRREDEDGKNKNVPAGTIVDTQITHPKEMDFYLVSHASLQGTSRPTKYHKLWDENDMDENSLEELTYYLCHLFSRCTRSVSYPAPTYYAHLAAFRGRTYLEGSPINLANLGREMDIRKIKDVITSQSPMFFV